MKSKPELRQFDGKTCLYFKRDEFNVGDTRLCVEDWVCLSSPSESVRILSITGTYAYYSYVPLLPSEHRLLCYNYCDDALKLRDHDFYRHTLVLGCGGGAMPRWLLQEYPEVTVDVVDFSPEIIAACKKYFLYSWEDSDRLTYYCTDAAYYESPGYRYEFIFCDLFNGTELAPVAYDPGFVQKLHGMLDDNGILVINCGWSDLKKVTPVYDRTFEYVKVVDRDPWQTEVIMAGKAPF